MNAAAVARAARAAAEATRVEMKKEAKKKEKKAQKLFENSKTRKCHADAAQPALKSTHCGS